MKFSIKLLSIFFFFIFFATFSVKLVSADTITISGSVKDSSGHVIGGATVSVNDANNDSTTTDPATGDYNLSVSSGTYNIEVTPPSGSSFSSAIAMNQNISTDTTLNFILTPAGTNTLSGTLYDSLGNPLSNQLIRLSGGGTYYQATTDSNGSYSVQAPSGTYILSLLTEGNSGVNTPADYFINKSNFSLNQDIILNLTLPFDEVNVHVQDSSQNAISDVIISTPSDEISGSNLNIGGGITDASGTAFYSSTTDVVKTDASGNVTLWLLPSGNNTFQLLATPPNGSGYPTTSLSNVSVSNNNQAVTITFSPQYTLSGTLYDPLGNPLSNQIVRLSGGGTYYQATTDSNGNYSVQAPAGNYQLNLQNPDNGVNAPYGYQIYKTNFSLTQNITLDLTLPFNKVNVHVQDSSGTAVGDVIISDQNNRNTSENDLDIGGGITGASGDAFYSSTTDVVKTDDSGNATLWLLPSSTDTFQLQANPPDVSIYPITTVNNVSITNNNENITITLPLQYTLSGTLYDPLGNPLSNQIVRLIPSGGGTYYQTATDSNGSYSVQAPSGTYTLSLFTEGNSGVNTPYGYQIYKNNFSLTQNTSLDFTLPFVKVLVHVQDQPGSPVSNVVLSTPSGESSGNNLNIGGGITDAYGTAFYSNTIDEALTDSSGDVALWLLPSNNPFRLLATPPSNSVYSQFTLNNITITTDPVQNELVALQYNHSTPITTVTLSPAPYADGTSADPMTVALSATAANGYTVPSGNTYYKLDNGTQMTYSAPFIVTGAGSHTITYWSVDNSGVTEAQNTKTFTLTESYNLTGTVYNDANQNGIQGSGEQGIAGSTVSLTDGQNTVNATTDSNGNYTFPNIESGNYTETLTVPSGYIATTANPVSIPLAANTTQNFGVVVLTPTATPTPTQAPSTTVTFDDTSPVAPLTGEYKGINWGTISWDVDASITSDNTHSASFHSSAANSETFSFDTPEVLISADLESNSNQTALITLSCSGNPPTSKQVLAGGTATLTTNWITPCTTVTVTSSNGWKTNLDNIIYASSSNASPTPTPTPNGQILGNNNIGSQIDSGDTGYINGSKFTTGATGGTAQSMSVFVSNVDNATHSQYQMAIYADNNGKPGALIANTTSGNLSALSWNTLPISATLQSNTTYWLMYNTNSRTAQDLDNMYYTPNSPGTAAYAKHAFGSWPVSFPAATLDTPEFSIYVTYQ